MRFKPHELTPNAWAVKAGVSRTVWADMRRHGNPSRRTLEKLLVAVGSSLAEFEALRVSSGGPGQEGMGSAVSDRGAAAWGGARLSPLPLVATSSGGEWGNLRIETTELRLGEVLERVQRPAALVNDPAAYAVTVIGNSMWPRFRSGRRVAVSPKAAAAVGDDVLVMLKGGTSPSEARSGITSALIKELVSSGASGVELRQFNPDVTFHVPRAEISTVEKVVGELL